MPKFLSYQRPNPINRNQWSGRPGAPIPSGKGKSPKPVPAPALPPQLTEMLNGKK